METPDFHVPAVEAPFRQVRIEVDLQTLIALVLRGILNLEGSGRRRSADHASDNVFPSSDDGCYFRERRFYAAYSVHFSALL